MNLHEPSECTEMLIDLVCYELHIGKLSPEMRRLFDVHLEECPACCRRVLNYRKTLAESDWQRNYG